MPADPPTVTLYPAGGYVQLDLDGLDQPGAVLFTVWRHHTGSGAVVGVRGLVDVQVLGPQYLGYDFEVPIESTVRYRVDLCYGDMSVDTGPESVDVRWVTADAWLKDPANPDRNMVVTVVDYAQQTWPLEPGIHRVLNRRTPVVVSDVRQAARGTLTLATLTDAEYWDLLEVTADGTPLLFQAPLSYGVGSMYVAVGNLVENRADRIASTFARTWALDLIEVDPPVSTSPINLNRYADVLAVYATYQTLLDDNVTYLELLQGVPGVVAPRPPLPWRGQ
jgi:hypothetical protein